jgi:hypothetical protein
MGQCLVRLRVLDNSYFLRPFSLFSVYYVFLRAASISRLLMYAFSPYSAYSFPCSFSGVGSAVLPSIRHQESAIFNFGYDVSSDEHKHEKRM